MTGGNAEKLSGFADPCFLVSVLETEDRNKAMLAFRQVLTDLKLIQLSVIAFWDGAEGIWRTWHPHGSSIAFDRFVTSEAIKAAKERHQLEIAAYRAEIDRLRRESGEGK
jgi:hypothetical protein